MLTFLERYLLSVPFGLFAVSGLLWCFFFPVAKAPSNIFAVAIIVSAVLYLLFSADTKIMYKNSTVFAGALLLLMPILWFFHPGPGSYGAYAKDSLFCLYMLGLFCWSKLYPERVNIAINCLLIGTVLTAIASLMQYFGVVPKKEPGLALGLHNGTLTGAFSLLLVFSAAVISYLFKQAKQWREKFFLFFGILICIADLIIVVPGRTGYLAFLVLGSFILYNLYKKNRLFAIGLVMILFLFAMNSSVFLKRIAAGRTEAVEYSKGGAIASSVGARFEMWKVSWRNFTENPIIGAGTNGFSKRWMEEGFKKNPYAFNNSHSTYFHVLGNYGLLGFGILMFFIYTLSVASWRNRNSLTGVTVGCFVIVFIVGSLTNTMVTSDFYLTWLAIISGIAAGLPVSLNDVNPMGDSTSFRVNYD